MIIILQLIMGAAVSAMVLLISALLYLLYRDLGLSALLGIPILFIFWYIGRMLLKEPA